MVCMMLQTPMDVHHVRILFTTIGFCGKDKSMPNFSVEKGGTSMCECTQSLPCIKEEENAHYLSPGPNKLFVEKRAARRN